MEIRDYHKMLIYASNNYPLISWIIASVCFFLFAQHAETRTLNFDHQRDSIIYSTTNQLFKLNLSTNESTLIAGNGTNGCTPENFNDIRSITNYYEQGKITGYLVAEYSCYCLRLVQADPPYNTSVYYGNCTHQTHIKGAVSVATGSQGSNYIYTFSDQYNKTITTLTQPNLGKPFISYYQKIPETTGMFSVVHTSNNLLVSGYSQGKVFGLNPYNLLNQFTSGNIYTIRQYPNGILINAWGTNTNRSVYFGPNASSATNQPCESSQYTHDTILLPNGTLVQLIGIDSINLITNNCAIPPYDRKKLTPTLKSTTITHTAPTFSHTKTPTQSFSQSTHELYSYSNSRTKTLSRPPLSQTTSIDISSTISKLTKTQDTTSTMSKTQDNTSTIPRTQDTMSETRLSRTQDTMTETRLSRTQDTMTETRLSRTQDSISTMGKLSTISPLKGTFSIYTTPSRSVLQTLSSTKNVGVRTVTPGGGIHVSPSDPNVKKISVKNQVTQVTSAYISGFVSTSSAVNGPKTTAALMVINGQCGETRELAFYENPFMTRLVAFGNIGFMLIISGILAIIGYFRKKPLSKGEWDKVLREHKVYIFLFTSWFYLTPGIVTAYFKYSDGWLEGISCFFGSVLILLVIFTLCFGATDVHVHCVIKDPPYYIPVKEWFGLEYMCSIIDGYNNRKALFLDIFIMLLLSFTTMMDNCDLLGYITVGINLLYIIFCLATNSIQPKMVLHGNIIFSLGQTICIVLSMLNVEIDIIIALLYASSIIGVIWIMVPPIYEYISKKSNRDISDTELSIILTSGKTPSSSKVSEDYDILL